MGTKERRIGVKYMEGYLEFKESSKWINYWVVLHGFKLCFFKNENTNTNLKENQIKCNIDIANCSFSSGKTSKDKFEFELKADRKKYLFRTNSELLRLQWVHSIGLAAQGKPPVTSTDFESEPGNSPTNNNESPIRKISNQYTEVPIFNISPDVVPRVTDEEMQKTILGKGKHHSFSSHCKKLLGIKEKLKDKTADAEEPPRPESLGAEATPEALYDEFPDNKPPWFFGKLTRENAEAVLQPHPEGSFLVRESETVRKLGAYTLSLKHRDKFRHHKIETVADGNLVIKGHEDKPFPNLATLMKYFTKSQEQDIIMKPVICGTSNDDEQNAMKGYELMGARPAPPGCEEGADLNGSVETRGPVKHSYENIPSKPPLRSRVTSPDLFRTHGHGYENIPNKSRSSTIPGYESMDPKGAPVLPPRQPVVKHPGYENIPEKEPEPLPPRQSTSQGYENLPPKDEEDPPALPPRIPSRVQGYENVPTRDERSPPSKALPYQNIRPVPSRRQTRQAPPLNRANTVPAHIMQNTLGKGSI
nr:uncharacterized protein LOC131774957 isoform X1 [Pocillopora verrucosa]